MAFPIPILSNLIEKGIDSVIRWKESSDKVELTRAEFEQRKLEWKAEMTKYLVEQVGRPEREFRAFVQGYEGSAEQVHPAVQFARGIIRPILTLWATLIITLVILGAFEGATLQARLDSIPPSFWNIFQIIFGFWFGGRAVQHVVDKYSQGKVEERKQEAQAAVEVERLKAERARIEHGLGVEAVLEDEQEDDFTPEEKARAFRRGRRR